MKPQHGEEHREESRDTPSDSTTIVFVFPENHRQAVSGTARKLWINSNFAEQLNQRRRPVWSPTRHGSRRPIDTMVLAGLPFVR